MFTRTKRIKTYSKKTLEHTNLPVIVQPNAGLPTIVNGQSLYTITPEEFCNYVESLIDMGVSIIGGCCGTTPDFIKCLKSMSHHKKRIKNEIL